MRDLERQNSMPFARLVGFVFEEAPVGVAIVSLDIRPEHENSQGAAHGGILPVIMDAAGATAVASKAPNAMVMTADLRINYIAPAVVGQRILARGEVTHFGGSTAYAQINVTDPAGTLLALGQITCVVKARRPDAGG